MADATNIVFEDRFTVDASPFTQLNYQKLM